jgi:isopropylmalate/homocitrate/citramalate synthase
LDRELDKGEAVATFLTQDETEAIRRHIDDHRQPGTYEPGKWSVGHNNRRPEVLGLQLPDHYPERVRLRDITLRTIEQTPGVAVTRPERARLARALVEAGVPSLQLSFGSYKTPSERLRAEVEAIRDLDPEVEITTDGAAVEEDVDRAAEAGFDVVQFLSPSMPGISPIYLHEAHFLAWEGKEWRGVRFPRTLEEQIERGKRLIAQAKSREIKISASINMLAYASDDYIQRFCSAMAEAGADQICLYDGSSGLGYESWSYVVSLAKEAAPTCEIGAHTHNMFGLAVASALAAAHAGADVLEVSTNGYCAASGQADLAEVASALTILYGVETGIDLSRLTSLRRLGEDITRVYVARNKPITGDEVFNWGGMEIIVHELEVDPLLHWCIEPAVVGNEKRWIIDKTSGPWTMQTKLDELGIVLDRDLVYDLLSAVKEEMDIHKRVLSDDELRELADRVREGAALATA